MSTIPKDMPQIDTEHTVIKRDGVTVAVIPTSEVLAWFHREHSYSMFHAIRYEGYSIEEEEA